MNLLIVNDAVLEAETMKREIAWANLGIHEVYLAFSAEEGRNVVENNKIDILLCDIEMPGENGITFIRWLKDNSYDIDCIILTCHADFSYAKEAVSLGCQDYILLPVKYDEVEAIVQKVVKRRLENLNGLQLQELGLSWLSQKAKDISSVPVKSAKDLTEECQRYILDHIGDVNLNINDISSQLFLSPTYINRIFKKEKGVSINQWILKKRMELAIYLMKTTSHSAITIAEQVGYLNYPYFSTVFKKYSGLPPAQYIKNIRQDPGI